MAEFVTNNCGICLEKVDLRDLVLNPSVEGLNITENPVTCNKCNTKNDTTYELNVQNESIPAYFTNKETKEEFLEDSIKTEAIVEDQYVLFNTDIPVCIEERIPINILYCYQCNYGTNHKQNLTDHIFTHRFKCNQCNYTAPEHSMLMSHQTIHVHKQPLLCNICNYDCLEMDMLVEHMATHASVEVDTNEEKNQQGKEISECHDCNYRTNSKIGLKLHVRMCINGKSTKADLLKQLGEVKIIQCEKCEYSTTKSKYLRQHLLCIHGDGKLNNYKMEAKYKTVDCMDKPFKCNSCDFSTKYSTNLKNHKRVHFSDKPFQCSLCHHRFFYRDNLQVHMFEHSTEKIFSCNKCDFITFSNSTLKGHKKIHFELFKCSLCSYNSRYMSNLKKHLTIHSNERNFSCDKCDFKTNLNINLKRHKIRHSNVQPFKCNLCDFRTKRKRYLDVHKLVHSNSKPF